MLLLNGWNLTYVIVSIETSEYRSYTFHACNVYLVSLILFSSCAGYDPIRLGQEFSNKNELRWQDNLLNQKS